MTDKSHKRVWQQENWPKFYFESSGLDILLRRYDDACGQLYGMHAALSDSIQLEAQLDVLVSEAISTSAIEGEHLTRDSVRQSLKRNLGISQASRQHDRKADGVANLLLASRTPINKPLDEAILFTWHKEVLGDGKRLIGRDIVVGTWRDERMEIVSGNIGYEKLHYAAPPADMVPTEMKTYLEWFNNTAPLNSNSNDINGPTRAALAHLWNDRAIIRLNSVRI